MNLIRAMWLWAKYLEKNSTMIYIEIVIFHLVSAHRSHRAQWFLMCRSITLCSRQGRDIVGQA